MVMTRAKIPRAAVNLRIASLDSTSGVMLIPLQKAMQSYAGSRPSFAGLSAEFEGKHDKRVCTNT